MITLSKFNAVMEVVRAHLMEVVQAHIPAAQRRLRECLSGAAFALTAEAEDVIKVLLHQSNNGAIWPCAGIQQPDSKQHNELYALIMSRGKDSAVAARGATMYNTRLGPMVRLCLTDVLDRPISPLDPLQDMLAKDIIGDLPESLRRQHRDFCYQQSDEDGSAFDQQYQTMLGLRNTATKKTLMMLGCSSKHIKDANLIEGLREKMVICLPPELAEGVWVSKSQCMHFIRQNQPPSH